MSRRSLSRGLLSAVFVGAGALHFTSTEAYVQIVPPYLPEPRALVLVSGAAEIAGGLAVLAPRLRRPGGLWLIALLVAVFPANVHMALNADQLRGIPAALLWLRLPLQAVLVAWVWSATLRRRPVSVSGGAGTRNLSGTRAAHRRRPSRRRWP